VLIEEFAEARIVVDAANDPANLTALFQPVERESTVERPPRSRKSCGENAHPPPAPRILYLALFSIRLAHIESAQSARKNTPLFLQMQAMIADHGISGAVSLRIPTSMQAYNGQEGLLRVERLTLR